MRPVLKVMVTSRGIDIFWEQLQQCLNFSVTSYAALVVDVVNSRILLMNLNFKVNS